MPGSALMGAKDLRKSLLAEIAVEKGERTFEHAGKDKTEVTHCRLERLRLRLEQVEARISSYD